MEKKKRIFVIGCGNSGKEAAKEKLIKEHGYGVVVIDEQEAKDRGMIVCNGEVLPPLNTPNVYEITKLPDFKEYTPHVHKSKFHK